MNGDSAYNLMFGPDICGPGTKKVHVIFNYKGKNLLIKKDVRCKVGKGVGFGETIDAIIGPFYVL